MTSFANSGQRILNIAHEALKQNEKLPTAEAWANVLGLEAKTAKSDPHDVNQQLVLLRKELDLLEEKMSATEFSAPLYKPYIKRVRNAVTPGNITATWNNYKQQFTAETILALRYCSEILSDEPECDFEELENLLSKLSEFEQNLDSTSVNEPTYRFVKSQIEIIKNAIRNYPVAGGSAIRTAFSEGFSDLNAKAEELRDKEQGEFTTKIGGFWRDLKSAGKEFVEADRIAKAYIGLINTGQSLAENAISLLSGPSS